LSLRRCLPLAARRPTGPSLSRSRTRTLPKALAFASLTNEWRRPTERSQPSSQPRQRHREPVEGQLHARGELCRHRAVGDVVGEVEEERPLRPHAPRHRERLFERKMGRMSGGPEAVEDEDVEPAEEFKGLLRYEIRVGAVGDIADNP